MCSKGRKAEGGVIPTKYQLVKTGSSDCVVRTEQNVIDSHCIVAFTFPSEPMPPPEQTRNTFRRSQMARNQQRECPKKRKDWVVGAELSDFADEWQPQESPGLIGSPSTVLLLGSTLLWAKPPQSFCDYCQS
jgi:hypothetical protein